ncbi:MAG: hypothetical protein EPO11_06590 [Gammaproteobacteria bacterium]|nr:MAG: hypothetical protein EPO11_06590 [Gammaproteobacteria bacterium]
MTTHRCCICLSSNDISLIHLNKTQDAIELLLSETIHYDEAENIPLVLSGIVQQYTLASIPTYWVLSPDYYQLFLIESLPVKAEEFHEALNWRIKSLLSYPIKEATIDYFKLPPKKSSPDNFMIAAITAKTSQLFKISNIMRKSNIELTTIDIPELAMRNLTALYETDEKSTAFIYFYEHLAILNISCQKTLYFTRHIELTDNAAQPTHYEQLCLNILRYFDYFQSQWRHPSPNRIFIGSEKENTAEIAKILSQNLSLSVEPFVFKSVALDASKLRLLEKKYLLSFGGALREEQNHATPGN